MAIEVRRTAGRLLAICSLLAACAGPTPPPPSGAPPTTGPPILRIDGLASVTVPAGLTVWKAPATGAKDAIKDPFERGTVLFLVDGPRDVDGTTWWQVQAENADPTRPFVWVRGGPPDKPSIAPLAVRCPAADALIDPAAIRPLSPVRRVACFGSRDLRLKGVVSCTASIAESMVSGPTWLDNSRTCDLDGALNVTGQAVWPASSAAGLTSVAGEVTGHFADPESATCGLIPFGVSVSGTVGPPDPEAVLICREQFVVTSLTPS